jgi:hypothetical protein
MAEIKVTYRMDDNELWSRIFGAAPESWSWWRSWTWLDGTDWNKAGRVRLGIDDPDYGEGEKVLRSVITMTELVTAIEKAPAHVQCDLIGDNMDADSADVILQIAVLGEVIYG